MLPEAIAQFAPAFCSELNKLKPGWTIQNDIIRGPEDAAVRFCTLHLVSSPGHADVEFSFQDGASDSLRLLDCVMGFGENIDECASSAAKIWGSTSAPALLELKYSRKGKYADHYFGHEPHGLKGWHSICSPIIGWGRGDGGKALQEWWLSTQQVLPAIAPALADLRGDQPHAVKILLGGQDIAEVRVDGQHHEAASAALLALNWPRQASPSFARAFAIAIHRE